MAKISLLLDEDVRPLLAAILRQRGYDAVHVKFNDGTKRVINFEPWLAGHIFRPFKNKSYFKSSLSMARKAYGRTRPTSHKKPP